MKRLAIVLFAILAVNAFALDPIWRMHYTLGPDSHHAPTFAAGAGVSTNFDDNMLIPVSFWGMVSNDIDIGGKLDIFEYDEMSHAQISVDVGGRYWVGKTSFLEVDGYFGLNRNNGSAVVASYGYEQFIAKSFSNFYEFRAGILNGVTGNGGYVKFATGMTPTLYFGNFFRTMIEINMSESIGHLQDDFMIDIVPKLELSFSRIRLRLDIDLGIMQEKNNDQKTAALYAIFVF